MTTKMLQSKITKQKSVFSGLTLNEPVNMEMLDLLLNSTLLQKEKKKNGEWREDESILLTKYKALVKEGKALVYYERTKAFGRHYAKNGVGLVVMRSRIRHTLAKAVGLRDYDIVNCHPVLLIAICEEMGWSCPVLKDYVKNRDPFLERLMTEITGLVRKSAKSLPLRLMYLGALQNWANDEGISLHEIPQWVLDWGDALVAELEKIASLVEKDNPTLVKDVEKGKHDAGWNRASAILSSFLQEYENRILEVIYRTAYNKGWIIDNVGVLAYDGIMLGERGLPTNICEILSAEILKETGFSVKIVEKALDNAYTLEELMASQMGEEMFPPEVLLRFDAEYFKTLPDYRTKKMYYEIFVCKIQRPPIYAWGERDGWEGEMRFAYYSQNDLKSAFGHLNSGKKLKTGGESKFIFDWLEDEEVRCYNKMDFLPYNETKNPERHDPKTFNLFQGFSDHTKTPVENKASRDEVIKPFHDLGKELCSGNDGYYKFLCQYVAHMIQKPQEKCPIAFIIKGKQGTGKNSWLNVVGRLIGGNHFLSSCNPDDFFGTHADGFQHKLLVNMNETEGKKTFDYEGNLKSAITEDRIRVNEKFVKPFDIMNLARIIIFTNKHNPLPIDVRSIDRRYVMYETTDKYLGEKYANKKFWNNIHMLFKDPDFLACLFDYFNTLDLSDFDVRDRPITDEYIKMCRLYVPLEAIFLEDRIAMAKEHDQAQQSFANSGAIDVPMLMINDWDKKGYCGDLLYTDYIEFCKKYGYYRSSEKFATTNRSLYAKLDSLHLPIKRYDNQNKVSFRFNAEDVLREMKKLRFIGYGKDNVLEEQQQKIPDVPFEEDFKDYFVKYDKNAVPTTTTPTPIVNVVIPTPPPSNEHSDEETTTTTTTAVPEPQKTKIGGYAMKPKKKLVLKETL